MVLAGLIQPARAQSEASPQIYVATYFEEVAPDQLARRPRACSANSPRRRQEDGNARR